MDWWGEYGSSGAGRNVLHRFNQNTNKIKTGSTTTIKKHKQNQNNTGSTRTIKHKQNQNNLETQVQPGQQNTNKIKTGSTRNKKTKN